MEIGHARQDGGIYPNKTGAYFGDSLFNIEVAAFEDCPRRDVLAVDGDAPLAQLL
jgi:hypothetical protein